MQVIKVLALSMTLVIAGCSVKDKPIKIETLNVPVEKVKPRLNLKNPDPPSMKDVKWIVVTDSNYEKVFADLKKNNQRLILFALTESGYKAMRQNDAELIKFIKKQRSVLIAYQSYYEPK